MFSEAASQASWVLATHHAAGIQGQTQKGIKHRQAVQSGEPNTTVTVWHWVSAPPSTHTYELTGHGVRPLNQLTGEGKVWIWSMGRLHSARWCQTKVETYRTAPRGGPRAQAVHLATQFAQGNGPRSGCTGFLGSMKCSTDWSGAVNPRLFYKHHRRASRAQLFWQSLTIIQRCPHLPRRHLRQWVERKDADTVCS